ncbi:BLUF domain-containing protein [Sabulilitoribacter arenilitoris]|uniref:BLUF domain-containing protein n=1 Tax=Wocania arenilitoris TaxID=2044858 RepID=A0AAE3ENC9_9FLAO|nr:BLUF domain-containing protein [Wocania arenilitoris]MCF7567647.1 BLUF domain-containing protein [Wocania arenilitoris]
MLKTICYLSDLKTEDCYSNLRGIYSKAKENNNKNGISGILIYKKKNFLQVLEGEEDVVNATFKRILNDKRHHNVFLVIENNIRSRFFEDYNFGFTIIKDKDTWASLKGYFNWLRNADNRIANEIITMVENFIAH